MGTDALEVALTRRQVRAANALYKRYLTGWQSYDRVLHALKEHFPSNVDSESVLPKAVVLNQLYATRILAITAMAERIAEVFREEGDQRGPELVEKVAWLPQAGARGRHCRSFASKYCHFFVSEEHFPILDEFAGDALTYHLGSRGRSHYRRGPFTYLTYAADVDRVREAAGGGLSYAELDRYLWLCGQWLRHGAGEDDAVNREVRPVFGNPDARALRLLGVAFPDRG